MDIWLQRVLIGFEESIEFQERVCQIVDNKGDNLSLWKSDWLKDEFEQKIKDTAIVDKKELNKVRGKPIKREEFAIFPERY